MVNTNLIWKQFEQTYQIMSTELTLLRFPAAHQCLPLFGQLIHSSSQARVWAHGFRDPGKPAWAEHSSPGDEITLSANDSSCPVFINAFDRVLVFMNEVLKSWSAFLESQEMLGGCQPITLPLSWAVNGRKLALPKQGDGELGWLVTPVPKNIQPRSICQGLGNRVLRPWLVSMNTQCSQMSCFNFL